MQNKPNFFFTNMGFLNGGEGGGSPTWEKFPHFPVFFWERPWAEAEVALPPQWSPEANYRKVFEAGEGGGEGEGDEEEGDGSMMHNPSHVWNFMKGEDRGCGAGQQDSSPFSVFLLRCQTLIVAKSLGKVCCDSCESQARVNLMSSQRSKVPRSGLPLGQENALGDSLQGK